LLIGLGIPALWGDPAEDAQHYYESVLDSVGTVCQVDADCPAPLRCSQAACAEPPAMVGQSTLDTPSVLFYAGQGEVGFYVELAVTNQERMRGLMYRPSMRPDWGMLFVYPVERQLSFWMRNTFIPLDMVFMTRDCRVVGVVANAEPLTETSRSVTGQSQLVLELNAGQAAQYGIEPGVRCELINLSDSTLTDAAP
jgi:uncharacterized membrane protein (UPF0127 family)